MIPDRIGQIEIELGGVHALLTPERAVCLPRERAVLVADTHWGKGEALRRHGVGVPAGADDEQRSRLTRVIERTGATRVIVLGDLVHAPLGLTPRVIEQARAWVEAVRRLGVDSVELVEGNHDVGLGQDRLQRVLDELGIIALGARARLACGLLLRHHPPGEAPGEASERATLDRGHGEPDAGGLGGYVLCGHTHPAAVLRGMGDELKVHCFWADHQRCVLPAFSGFIAGKRIRRRRDDRVFAAAGDRVIELPAVSGPSGPSGPGDGPRSARQVCRRRRGAQSG